ncbi:WASP homolog-associated protein with actin; membranes and microtubules [Camelus dromedarius]|uniref:WASP homolog-associated protein with actin n=1 Tax=Camelus dromedarius TaxID=9838 RepID=A0A5N4CE89_CAMDR|nr:WASP homolog-associated protein with actin; membranes and microtubules [Camelus dromedarius]
MEDEQPDSLEGWVPVREDLFAEPERHQLRFLVAWNDTEGNWAGLLSAAGLRGAHRQLAALWPPLERCFPRLPPELDADSSWAWGLGLGLWTLVWPARSGPGEAALQELCWQLERYLGQAADGCGGAAVRDALFPVEGCAADYESPREFRERALRARRDEEGARLRQVLQGHEKAHTMVALMEVYQEEDEAYQEFVTVATMFFQYLLQPFRDMRELATSCKLAILKSLDEDDLGPKRIAALQKEAQEWTRRAEEAVVSIQHITVNYFEETVKALAGMQKQMEQDEKRFGQAAWATATPRLEKLKLMLARETLQLMRAKELCLNHRRAEIQGKVRQRKMKVYKQDEVVYYDPCESPEELKAVDHVLGLQDDKSLEVKELSRRCQQLESKRGRICARRAYLRNRKKRDKKKEEEQKKKEWINQERQKTLQRLRAFKELSAEDIDQWDRVIVREGI